MSRFFTLALTIVVFTAPLTGCPATEVKSNNADSGANPSVQLPPGASPPAPSVLAGPNAQSARATFRVAIANARLSEFGDDKRTLGQTYPHDRPLRAWVATEWAKRGATRQASELLEEGMLGDAGDAILLEPLAQLAIAEFERLFTRHPDEPDQWRAMATKAAEAVEKHAEFTSKPLANDFALGRLKTLGGDTAGLDLVNGWAVRTNDAEANAFLLEHADLANGDHAHRAALAILKQSPNNKTALRFVVKYFATLGMASEAKPHRLRLAWLDWRPTWVKQELDLPLESFVLAICPGATDETIPESRQAAALLALSKAHAEAQGIAIGVALSTHVSAPLRAQAREIAETPKPGAAATLLAIAAQALEERGTSLTVGGRRWLLGVLARKGDPRAASLLVQWLAFDVAGPDDDGLPPLAVAAMSHPAEYAEAIMAGAGISTDIHWDKLEPNLFAPAACRVAAVASLGLSQDQRDTWPRTELNNALALPGWRPFAALALFGNSRMEAYWTVFSDGWDTLPVGARKALALALQPVEIPRLKEFLAREN